MRRVVVVACLVIGAGCGSNEPASPPAPPAPASPPPVTRAPSAPPVAPPVPDTSTAVSAEDLAFCVAETNRYRAAAGLPPLDESDEVAAYAAEAARADHRSGQAHSYTSGPREPSGAYAENEVVRWPLTRDSRAVIARAIAAFWAEGPGGPHYENMRGDWLRVGCGLHLDGDRATLVQHFR